MLQTALALALSLAAPQDEAVRDPEAVALLQRAAEAAAALTSAAYESRSEVRRGGSEAPPAIATGKVRFAALAGEDPIGAKLAVEGSVAGAGANGGDLTFKVAYDGATVRGRFGAEKVVWEGPPSGDGAEILTIGEPLVLAALHERTPFAADLEAPDVRLGEDAEVGGEPCRAVVVQHGPEHRHERFTWYFAEDGLPRRRVAEVHRKGVFQIEVLQISSLIKNTVIYPTVFEFPAPAGYEVKPYVSSRPKGPELLAVGSEAPPFELKDAQGGVHTLADYRGRLLVLDFWGTWCPPCKKAMPLVQRIHERFAEDERVAVVGLATSERRGADPAGYMEENGYTYACLLNGEVAAPDYRAFALPTFYVIGPDGKVLHASVGFDPNLHHTIGALIEKTLAGMGG